MKATLCIIMLLITTLVTVSCKSGAGPAATAAPEVAPTPTPTPTPEVTLASIAVTPGAQTILAGATRQFVATGTYSDTTTADITTSVVWSSSASTVASINASTGLATGVGVGTTTITATLGVSGNTTLTLSQMGGAIQGTALNLTTAVTTLAGTALNQGSANGTGAAASFTYPMAITSDGTNLYVADTYNYLIRKIVISTGVVTTLAGTALVSDSTDATGTAARFDNPTGITTDGTNLYVVDNNNEIIRKIVISTGVVTTLVGTALTQGSTNRTGAGASFYEPADITSDGTNLYVIEVMNFTIRKIQ